MDPGVKNRFWQWLLLLLLPIIAFLAFVAVGLFGLARGDK
jgi:hypothetical protein